MVGNFVLRRRVSGAVKRNFRPYNRWYTSPNENFEYGYTHSNVLFNIYSSKAQHFAPNWSFVSNVNLLRQPIASDATYDVGAPTVYRRTYWRKFLMLSNQTSRYIRKCIRMIYKFSIYCPFISTSFEPRHEKTSLHDLRPDKTQPAQLQRLVRVFLDITSIDIILSKQRTATALIRLRECACWSVPLLFAYGINRFSHDVAHFIPAVVIIIEK